MDKHLKSKIPSFTDSPHLSFPWRWGQKAGQPVYFAKQPGEFEAGAKRQSILFFIHTLKLFGYYLNRYFSHAKSKRTSGLKPRFRMSLYWFSSRLQTLLGNANKWWAWPTLLVVILSACSENKPTINIAVASNFESTLKKIIKQYKTKNPEINININIIPGSSGVLANQIANKAPFDLFLSADTDKTTYIHNQQPELLTPIVYAIGQLALWIPDIDNSKRCIEQLKQVNNLVIANPKTAPYGTVAEIVIHKHKIKVEKLIHAANISQSFLYVKDGLAQAGFVAYSMLKDNKQGCQQIFQHRKLSQAMILLDDKAIDIYDYILSKEIQSLIANSGYNTL